jgi:hypothetical protein
VKKLLAILLLITLAAQTSGYFHPEKEVISIMQESDDKGEKCGEEKKEKEFPSCSSIINNIVSAKRPSGYHSCKPRLSPILDHLTPPPDVTL